MPVSAIVGYDGSLAANAAIEAGASLFPNAHGWITYLWAPPFASSKVRQRLHALAHNVDELSEMVQHEGEHEAQRLLTVGVALARTAGWDAEPLLKPTFSGEGPRLAQIADEMEVDLVLVGSRGLGNTQAMLGSVSDTVVRYSARPVLVVPYPMLAADYAALTDGPVTIGWDGSAGAGTAFEGAVHLFPDRDLFLVSVDDEGSDTALPSSHLPGITDREITRLNVKRGRGLHSRALSDALTASAQDLKAAAIVVGSRGRSTAREMLLGSVAISTLRHSHRPVIVVPSAWHAPQNRDRGQKR
ncbi:universal stress protein [Rhodococcus sp. C26F]